ncbi:MAG: YraN family protein [Acidobacteriota bacterium]|nr:YraN family protein [Acidobacteriota bacterium]
MPADSDPAGTDRRRALGELGEELAASHLRSLGYRVLAHNHRTRHGEIDLVAYDGDTLVFAEVKARRVRSGPLDGPGEGRRIARPGQFGTAFGAAALGWPASAQRRRLRRLALAWLAEARGLIPRAREIRFDAIGVLVDGSRHQVGIEHLEGAL